MGKQGDLFGFVKVSGKGRYSRVIDDLSGRRFGRLMVVGMAEKAGGATRWHCKCDCGASCVFRRDGLTARKGQSCGCVRREKLAALGREMRKHGGAGGSAGLYAVWKGMRKRCLNPHVKHWERYGGRGISVCPEWSDYAMFREWSLANGYEPGLTIDRRDNDGGYCPGNCRWATQSEQMRNTGKNRAVRRSDGRVFGSVAEASEATGGCSQANIVSACRGRHKVICGFGWEYVDGA